MPKKAGVEAWKKKRRKEYLEKIYRGKSNFGIWY